MVSPGWQPHFWARNCVLRQGSREKWQWLRPEHGTKLTQNKGAKWHLEWSCRISDCKETTYKWEGVDLNHRHTDFQSSIPRITPLLTTPYMAFFAQKWGLQVVYHGRLTKEWRKFKTRRYRFNPAASIHHQGRFPGDDQPNRTAGGTHVDGRKVGI